ncbi:hypothetical protein SAMN04488000_12270 [Lentzea albida]|uniref:Uncharacterized protein n=1 Tax=Lentzea albida TaxID=65499 RepID=A0A1H9WGB3_9PSEU|nr:hypothetical protein SAMN04488000_12270 [Lentzea albida]
MWRAASLGREPPVGRHRVDDEVAALEGLVRPRFRVERARAVDHAREHRGLGHGELGRGRAEVGLRRGGDPEDRRAERHEVEVAREDLVLAQRRFHAHGDAGFAQLAGDALLLGQALGARVVAGEHVHQVVLHVLLRQRRRALLHSATGVVAGRRPCGREPVDAVVVVEAAVLDREQRVLHVRRDPVRRCPDPVLVVQVRDRRAVPVRHRRHQRRVGVQHLREGGVHLVAEFVGQHPHPRGDRKEESCEQHAGEQAQPGQLPGAGHDLLAVQGRAPSVDAAAGGYPASPRSGAHIE